MHSTYGAETIYIWHRGHPPGQEAQREQVMAAHGLEGRGYSINENEAWVVMHHASGPRSTYKIHMGWEGAELHIVEAQAPLSQMLESYERATQAVLPQMQLFLPEDLQRHYAALRLFPLWASYALGHEAKLRVIQAAGFAVRRSRQTDRGGAVKAMPNPAASSDPSQLLSPELNLRLIECDYE